MEPVVEAPKKDSDDEEEVKEEPKTTEWKVEVNLAKEDEVGQLVSRLDSNSNGLLDSDQRAALVQELSANYAVFNLKSDPWKGTDRENTEISKEEVTSWVVEKQQKAVSLQQKGKRKRAFKRLNAICEENDADKELLVPEKQTEIKKKLKHELCQTVEDSDLQA